MSPRSSFVRAGALLGGGLLATALAGCERPPTDEVQNGYRGTAMVQVYNPRVLAEEGPRNIVPAALPAVPAAPGAPLAGQIYQNVQVLGGLSIGEFTRTMQAITEWVVPKDAAPEEAGCNYCHNGANFAEDAKYTKVVARKMLQMTQVINSEWKPHVQNVGVTCYTCHRGQPVPAEVWFADVDATAARGLGNRAGQNQATAAVNYASLPSDPFTPFLLNAEPIRFTGATALPTGNRKSVKQAEWTFALMTHMSQSLGVNCTYCHNSRAFNDWEQSPPQRNTAWYGIRMARALNNDYMLPLTDVFPAHRKGALGDVAKLNCATCHQGAYKPLYGAPMLKDYVTALSGPTPVPPPAETPAEAPVEPADSASMPAVPTTAAATGDIARPG